MEEVNKKIREKYREYIEELKEKAPELLTGEYSNIFCAGVLEGWEDAKDRILIVGEEAGWKKRDDWEDEISCSQQWVVRCLHDQIRDSKYGFARNNYPFWKRFREIIKCFGEKASFAYANIDVINSLPTGKKLPWQDRQKLHSTKMQILKETIEVIQPTLVIFFGWHNISLRHELESLYHKIYPEKENDTAHFITERKAIGDFEEAGIRYVFTYHPTWCAAKSNIYKNNDDYNEAIVKRIEKQKPC